MKPTIIRKEAQAFISSFRSFMRFAQHNGLTNAEREAIVTLVQMPGLDLPIQPPSTDKLV